jgi:quercetin dioxygenase-like cupin family protein
MDTERETLSLAVADCGGTICLLRGDFMRQQTTDSPVFNALGVLLEFLATPDEVKDVFCLIRGTIPPGVVVPLHSHPDPELFCILEGTLDVYQSTDASRGWTSAGAGDVAIIRGNVKHALHNRSSLPVTSLTVTKSELYEFFRQVAIPYDPNQPPAPPTVEVMQKLFDIAAEHGYWLASREENAAVGLATL